MSILGYRTAELAVHCSNSLGECPLYDDLKNVILWIDINNSLLYEYDVEFKTTKTLQVGGSIRT